LRMDDSDTNNWFMVDLDAQKRDLVWIERVAPESATNIDFQTKIVQQSMYFRIGYGFKNWRWAYGHAVT